MLEYDNSAFYYFSITLLTLYIIPSTYFTLLEVYRALFNIGYQSVAPRTSSENYKANKIKNETLGFSRLKKTSFLLNLLLLLFAWLLLLYLISLVRNDGEVNQFDPFTILGIDSSASLADIKKAYRKLSLLYHPDRNIGNKKAEEMFVKVAKAHEALTDEVSKENYLKYGNPDGKQALEVSIGLPRILLDNPKIVLILYLIGMVIIIPVAVGLWYSNSKQFGEKNVMYETYKVLYQLMEHSHRVSQMPEIIAASAECRAIIAKSLNKDVSAMNELYGKMKHDKLMVKPRYENPIILRGNLLFHAHVHKLRHLLTPSMSEDLDAMLAKAPELVEGAVEIAYQRRWLETTLHALKFSQCLVQGIWYKDDPLTQLPHLGDAEVKAINKAYKSNALKEFLKASDDDKKGLSTLSPEQRADVIAAAKIFPNITVDVKLFVEEDDEDTRDERLPPGDKIYEQDLVTLRVVITHHNVLSSSTVPLVHAPRFPKVFQEGWWLILSDIQAPEGKKLGVSAETIIHAIEKITDQTAVITHELKFMAPGSVGDYDLELHVVSDCYAGLDEKIDISFVVNPASELPEYKPHPEDLKLDNEPTLFEQMMAANMDEDSSDDEDDRNDTSSKGILKSKSEAVILSDDEDD
mmetsp:Transcript_20035/g.18189  ORF Transcript_20035/g.18189 Transcript_20035/m.18189 type:complete len:635 (+) Transcript_20035:62-1966(+)